MNIKKEEKSELELKMYFFVPYNISDKQMGIQAGHSALRYARLFAEDNPEVWDFVDNHETWIVLNGGTMNDTRDFEGVAEGTMNQIGDELLVNDIRFSYFHEPDMNNGLSALCFLCDERVFNYEDYPQFPEWIHAKKIEPNTNLFIDRAFISPTTSDEECERIMPEHYKKWVKEVLGGEKNLFLRNLLKGKKFA